eukprot:287158-Hanusia_phi.AAC.1
MDINARYDFVNTDTAKNENQNYSNRRLSTPRPNVPSNDWKPSCIPEPALYTMSERLVLSARRLEL